MVNKFNKQYFYNILDTSGPNLTTLFMAGICICGLLLPSSEDTDILKFRISYNLKLALAFVLGKNMCYYTFCLYEKFMKYYVWLIHIFLIDLILFYFRYDNDYYIATSIMQKKMSTNQ